jgi:hypothetical protein
MDAEQARVVWIAVLYDKWDSGEGGLIDVAETAEVARGLCEADAAENGSTLGAWMQTREGFGKRSGQARFVADVVGDNVFQWYAVMQREVAR